MEKSPASLGINHPNPVAVCGTQASWDGFIKVRVSRIPAAMLDQYWDAAREYIAAAFRPDAYEPFDRIYDKIVVGDYQLWCVFTDEMICAVVTMLIDYEDQWVLHVEYGGADWQSLGLWKDPLVELLSGFARHYGAKALQCGGRKGWLKVFPGAVRHGSYMRKEI
jgi:hypothetical protein